MKNKWFRSMDHDPLVTESTACCTLEATILEQVYEHKFIN